MSLSLGLASIVGSVSVDLTTWHSSNSWDGLARSDDNFDRGHPGLVLRSTSTELLRAMRMFCSRLPESLSPRLDSTRQHWLISHLFGIFHQDVSSRNSRSR